MTKKIFNLTGGAAPVFAWRLPQHIADYKQPRLPASQWINVVKGLTQKGVKLAEILDSRVTDWLTERGNAQVTREELAEAVSFALPAIKELRLSGVDAQYRRYSWSSDDENKDYNESLFYFPNIHEDFSDRIADLDEAISALNFDFEKLGADPDLVFRLDEKRSDLLQKQREMQKSGSDGPNTHFASTLRHICPDSRADFAHMRWSVMNIDGTRTLFVHEFQSDWAQKGRQNDWKGTYKPAPLVMETEYWSAFLLRRAMSLAVETGCAQLTWINGGAMANGGNIQGPAGLDEFYLKIIPSVAKKLAKPFDAELSLKDMRLKEGSVHRLAAMPITAAMKESFSPRIPVYSYARVVEKATFDPVAAKRLQKALQLRADEMFGVEHRLRVNVVKDIFGACEHQRAAGALIGKVADIAFSAEDPVQALDHEAFHFAYRYRFTSSERAQVRQYFEPGSPLLVRTVRLLIAEGDMDAVTQAMGNPEEAAAHAFSYWKKGHMSLAQLLPMGTSPESRAGISKVIGSFFPEVERFVHAIVDWMRRDSASPSDFVARIVRIHDMDIPEVDPAIEARVREFFKLDNDTHDVSSVSRPAA
jgi:hypothetical protein